VKSPLSLPTFCNSESWAQVSPAHSDDVTMVGRDQMCHVTECNRISSIVVSSYIIV